MVFLRAARAVFLPDAALLLLYLKRLYPSPPWHGQ
jgi:hypothetical protein